MMRYTLFFFFPMITLLAQDSTPNPASGLSQTFVMIAIALIFFYFILWRPEQKRRKAAEQMRTSLKKGDRVTAMGILGRVDRMTDHTVILKLVEGAKIEILKAAITDVQSGDEVEVSDNKTG